MRLDDADLVDRLAQRYVLGTLWGPARRRFAALVVARFDLRDRVDYWEERLVPLAWTLQPVVPSPLVWRRIRRALGQRPAQAAAGARRWAALAAACALAAIITGGGWWQTARQAPETVTETVIERVPQAVSVALVANEQGAALWFARIVPDSGELTVRVVTPPAVEAGKDYQLWLLAADGTPLSLGLLPQAGQRTLVLDAAALAAFDGSSMVAVSLEPAGGSPQAVPTGPVLYTAALVGP